MYREILGESFMCSTLLNYLEFKHSGSGGDVIKCIFIIRSGDQFLPLRGTI